MPTPLLTIEHVESEFLKWRKNKSYNSPTPIPEELCEQVRLLLQSFPRGEVLRRCGLTLRQAKVKGLLPEVQSTDSSPMDTRELNPFVKIPMMPEIHTLQPRSLNLTLQNGDKSLSIDNPTDNQIELIVTNFLR